MIKSLLNLAFRMSIPGTGHLARLLYRKELAPYVSTHLKKLPKMGGGYSRLTLGNTRIR
jgi:hypothetical protein